MRNKLLLFGTMAGQLIHILAMYMPGLSDILRIHPVRISTWLALLVPALFLLAAMEIHKHTRAIYQLTY